MKGKGKIRDSAYQLSNDVSKATATRDITELVGELKILKRTEILEQEPTIFNWLIIGSIGSYWDHVLSKLTF